MPIWRPEFGHLISLLNITYCFKLIEGHIMHKRQLSLCIGEEKGNENHTDCRSISKIPIQTFYATAGSTNIPLSQRAVHGGANNQHMAPLITGKICSRHTCRMSRCHKSTLRSVTEIYIMIDSCNTTFCTYILLHACIPRHKKTGYIF